MITQLILEQHFKTTRYKRHTTKVENTGFSREHRTFSKTENILGQKIILNKFKRIEITQSILFLN